MKHTFFSIDLLHYHAMRHLVEVIGQRRPLPLLIPLGVGLFEPFDVLCQLL
jgi:hypothetical protein